MDQNENKAALPIDVRQFMNKFVKPKNDFANFSSKRAGSMMMMGHSAMLKTQPSTTKTKVPHVKGTQDVDTQSGKRLTRRW